MRLGLRQAPQQILSLRQACPVCGSEATAAERRVDAIAVAMLGVADDPYAVCPGCFAPAGAGRQADEGYRRRVRRKYYERGLVLRLDASGRWLKRSLA